MNMTVDAEIKNNKNDKDRRIKKLLKTITGLFGIFALASFLCLWMHFEYLIENIIPCDFSKGAIDRVNCGDGFASAVLTIYMSFFSPLLYDLIIFNIYEIMMAVFNAKLQGITSNLMFIFIVSNLAYASLWTLFERIIFPISPNTDYTKQQRITGYIGLMIILTPMSVVYAMRSFG